MPPAAEPAERIDQRVPEALRAAASWQWQMLAYGVLLVLLMFFLPRGIVPRLAAAFASRR